MKILVLNCGSSSIKYQLIELSEETDLKAKGLLDRIGLPTSELTHQVTGKEKYKVIQEVPDHQVGINLILKTLKDPVHGVIHDENLLSYFGSTQLVDKYLETYGLEITQPEKISRNIQKHTVLLVRRAG